MTGELPAQQRRALERLVERGTLTAQQSEAVQAELAAETGPQRAGGLWEVLGYAGGALVLGGAGLLLGMSWEELSRAVRAGLLAAATILLVAVGLFIANGPRGVHELAVEAPSRRSRIVSVLFALASGTAAMTVGSGIEDAAGVDVSLVATLAGTAVAASATAALPSLPLLLATGAFAYGLALSITDGWTGGQLPQMVLLILLGLVWAALSVGGVLDLPSRDRAGRIRRETGLGIAAATALSGAQWTIGDDQAISYGTTFVLAVACFAAYLRLRSAVLLVFGVAGMTLAVPEAVYHWTDGALGGPLIVLLVGAVLLAVGGFGLRLRNRVGSGPD